LARVAPDGSRIERRDRIARLAGRGRGTGMPKAISTGGRLYVVWTDVVGRSPKLQGLAISAH
jgi:hypothetical protein